MALTRKGANYAFGTAGFSVDGIDSLTSVSAGREYTINTTAKDTEGEVAAHLYGGEKNTFNAEGYVTGAVTPVALGGSATVAGVSGVITRSSIQSSNEDFAKVSVEGEAYAAISYA